MASHINVLLNTFSGLNLPSTVTFPVSCDSTTAEVYAAIDSRLPIDIRNTRLIVTTLSNKHLPNDPRLPLSALLSCPEDELITLRLALPTCGGKGGFGSQLRAAGGRMSSKRKKNQGDTNSSSRNLDGRRLRTVHEAKALAEYLAIKPEMQKKEKEERRKRWEEIVESSERREQEIRKGKGKLDGQWVEDKEEAGERTRDAVLRAMQTGGYTDNLSTLRSKDTTRDESSEDADEDEDMESAGASSSKGTTPPSDREKQAKAPAKSFFGFDEDDEFMSDDSDDDASSKGARIVENPEPSLQDIPRESPKPKSAAKGNTRAKAKGKGRAK